MNSSCAHRSCSKDRYVWFPASFSNTTDVERHPWCVHCGVIQNLSADRPKKEGYWMNVLGRIATEGNLAQCQKRLIAKEIKDCMYLQDTFGTFGSAQKQLFISIVSKYCDLSLINLETIW